MLPNLRVRSALADGVVLSITIRHFGSDALGYWIEGREFLSCPTCFKNLLRLGIILMASAMVIYRLGLSPSTQAQ